MKYKLNQRGFSAVEAIIILLILGIIGFAGWWVWKSQKDANQSLNNAANSNQSTKQTTPKKTSTQTEVKKVEKSYKFGATTLYYTPPTDWTVKEEAVKDNNAGYMEGTITLTSPDYKTSTEDGECLNVVAGKVITISVNGPTTYEKLKAIVLNSDSDQVKAALVKNSKEVTMAKQNAIQYQSSPGECFYETVTATVKGTFEVDVKSESDDNVTKAPYLKDPYANIYNQFVASIRFQ